MNLHRLCRSVDPDPALLVAIAVALLLPALKPLAAQTPATTPTPQATSPAPAQTESQATKLTPKQAREAQIAADTEKLFQLAQELKVEVDKSSKDTMSLSVIKKSEEIEKLARQLKQDMRAN